MAVGTASGSDGGKAERFKALALPHLDDIYTLVGAACDEANVDCQRVDQQIFDESNLARIYNLILSNMPGPSAVPA